MGTISGAKKNIKQCKNVQSLGALLALMKPKSTLPAQFPSMLITFIIIIINIIIAID